MKNPISPYFMIVRNDHVIFIDDDIIKMREPGPRVEVYNGSRISFKLGYYLQVSVYSMLICSYLKYGQEA